MTWYVTLSYSAAQAPMKRCSGTFLVAFAEVCGYGFDPTGQVTTDQFGNAGVSLFNRMLGPRYPHRWASGTCDDYRGFWQDYEAARSRNSVVASSWSSSFQSDPASRIRQDRQGFATVSGLPTVNSNTC